MSNALPERVHVTLTYWYWGENRQFNGTEKSDASLAPDDIALALDNVYTDLQAQSNDTGAVAIVIPLFRDVLGARVEALSAQFPPKLIMPIRKVIV